MDFEVKSKISPQPLTSNNKSKTLHSPHTLGIVEIVWLVALCWCTPSAGKLHHKEDDFQKRQVSHKSHRSDFGLHDDHWWSAKLHQHVVLIETNRMVPYTLCIWVDLGIWIPVLVKFQIHHLTLHCSHCIHSVHLHFQVWHSISDNIFNLMSCSVIGVVIGEDLPLVWESVMKNHASQKSKKKNTSPHFARIFWSKSAKTSTPPHPTSQLVSTMLSKMSPSDIH